MFIYLSWKRRRRPLSPFAKGGSEGNLYQAVNLVMGKNLTLGQVRIARKVRLEIFRLSKKNWRRHGVSSIICLYLILLLSIHKFLVQSAKHFYKPFQEIPGRGCGLLRILNHDCICNVVEFHFSRLTAGGRGLSQTNDPGILIYSVHHFSPNEWSFPPAKSARGNVCVRQRVAAANCPFSFYLLGDIVADGCLVYLGW